MKEKDNSKDEFEDFEESQTSKDSENDGFNIDLGKYDQHGKIMKDMDLYPIRDAVPRRNYPKEISDEEFFGEEEDDSEEDEKYLER